MLGNLNSLLFALPVGYRLLCICLPMTLIAVLAVWFKHLTVTGAVAAWFCGVIILFCARFEGFLLFCIFYVSCNAVGHIFKTKNKIEKKGSNRDWAQVFANGFIPALSSIIYFVTLKDSALVMFSASVAEACADTWAGDIGRKSKRTPVSIRNFKPVEKGTSGGVSALGFVSALLASIMIAMFHNLFYTGNYRDFLIIIVASFAGCSVDSYLGATCQALYKDKDGKITEKETDELIRGAKWIDNDMVNLMSNIFSAVLALTLVLIRT